MCKNLFDGMPEAEHNLQNFQAATALVDFNFVYAALVAATLKLGIEPFADDFECEFLRDGACPDGDAVRIVVLFG